MYIDTSNYKIMITTTHMAITINHMVIIIIHIMGIIQTGYLIKKMITNLVKRNVRLVRTESIRMAQMRWYHSKVPPTYRQRVPQVL